jgi:hypothetical protein
VKKFGFGFGSSPTGPYLPAIVFRLCFQKSQPQPEDLIQLWKDYQLMAFVFGSTRSMRVQLNGFRAVPPVVFQNLIYDTGRRVESMVERKIQPITYPWFHSSLAQIYVHCIIILWPDPLPNRLLSVLAVG